MSGANVSGFTPQLLLSEIKPGETCRVCTVDHQHPTSQRLIELGFIKGELIEVKHEAPFSRDPIVIIVGDMRLALRRDEASAVFVERINAKKDSTR